ncbi:hypothetical protein CC78DRAFT_568199 [Lojkania enalia]|uniref:Uncharacterized protein n=1 Tax=Lojkania enalia TaxID=147567 RepID=A0A9P4KB83_9PLEO|nr:hypothetical protein CC78DRAFT_568199 [Didymosphaeria enalia]
MSALPVLVPRFLLPRGHLLLRPYVRPLRPLAYAFHYSAAAAKPPSIAEQLKKQRKDPAILAQPDKYRPPSHGKRLPRSETVSKSYGPKLTEEDKHRMRTKKYPNMMAPEGTFMHWFLHNKAIHSYITLGILVCLAIAAWYMDFMHKTIYGEMIPSTKEFLRHPIASTSRFIEIYKMQKAYDNEVYSQQRLRKYEDVQKRKQYRLERIREAEERGEEYQEDPRFYIDEEGVRRRRVKRWFGIWE